MRRVNPKWCIGTLILVCFPLSLAASDWWNWRGPKQTGVSPETDLPDSWSPDKVGADNLIWKAPYGSRSTPLVMNGHVYFINYSAKKMKEGNKLKDVAESIQERVLCLDANTGKLVWEHKFNVWHSDVVTVRLGWTNLAGDPVTGNIYAHGTQGLLMCFSKDGKILWQHSLTEEYGRITGYGGRVTSPVVDGDLVILGMLNSNWGDHGKGANRFVAFDKNDGKVVWWSDPGGQVEYTYYSTPVCATINGQRLVISGGADGGVHAMQVSTGKPVWTYPLGRQAINSSPVVDGHFVFIGQGEENPDNTIKGRIVCLDASQVEKGEPKLVWKKDGIKARYTSPIINEGRFYITDDAAALFCLDATKGNQLWSYNYGRVSRGSPVFADGKIYVGEVNSVFHILAPGPKDCESLHEQEFYARAGSGEIEINGSPAIANGRIYFSTSEETYSIGKKEAKAAAAPTTAQSAVKAGPVAQVQVVPADVVLHPGESVNFTVRGFDADGNLVGDIKNYEWSLPTPPVPPGAKQGPPALKGQMDGEKLTVDAKVPNQAGYVVATLGKMSAKVRIRVAPMLPYTQDFATIPDGAAPSGWVNTQGKFLVKTIQGEKVLAKVNDKASPLFARGNAYLAEPGLRDYTIQCDVMGTQVGTDMPDIGVVVNRYTLMLQGNIQKMRIVSWPALPRVDETIDFPWGAGRWYTVKATTEKKGDKMIVKGKCWERGTPEPQKWSVELTDAYPNSEGAPALYGYVLGIPSAGGPGTEVYYANVRVSKN